VTVKEVIMAETLHTHDEDVTTGHLMSAMTVVRLVLTLGGAALLVIAMFQTWIHGVNGDTLAFNAYWRMNPATDVNFWRSAALVPLGCAIVGIIGLMTLGGWITRLAGAIAIVAFTLVVVELARASAIHLDDIGAGLWLMLGGGLIVLIGSLTAPAAAS
jgi:hypothetical protein